MGSSHRRATETALSAREKRVLQFIGGANTNKEIAAVLGISPATVKRHVENILRKLGLRNRIEAALYAAGLQRCPLEVRPANCPLEAKAAKERDLAA